MSAKESNVLHMKELIEKLKEADVAYYRDDNPIMSDREYDELTAELQLLESKTGVILSGSPTQRVSGEILESLTPVPHTRPMLSANKTKDVEALVKFANKSQVILSWKLDGLTLVLRYKDGKLDQAITRGTDGIIGEDVTHTVRTFLNVPLTIPTTDAFEVRGEGVISWEHFDLINSGLEEPYRSARNLAAGSTRKLDASESGKRFLEFFAFDLVSDYLEPRSKLAQLQLLERNGFSVVPYIYLDALHKPDIIRDAIRQFDPEKFAYPVDGLIMEYDDRIYGSSLGATGHHENRMIALKWEDEVVETEFLGVRLATTRTGMVSITGLFKPVELGGTTVSHAYLHNLDIFDEFQFGIGDRIQVYKANMIIPQIYSNRTQSNTFVLPMTCPCCGEPLVAKTTSGGTRQLYCENPSCSAKLIRKFTHFCSKTRMNITGISERTMEKLIGNGWVHTFGDLYTLEKHKASIVETEGFGEKSFARLQAAIEKSRHCTLAKFIAGLGIPQVGRHAGRDLEKFFDGSWNSFEQAIRDGFDFTQLPDFGETMHNNIYAWYADAEEATLWKPLLDHIVFEKENNTMSVNSNNPFAGKTVVATGKLENYTRDGIQNKLLSLGAIPASSVTKKTDFLIVGENAGSKLAKAASLGIRTLTEAEFEAMISE